MSTAEKIFNKAKTLPPTAQQAVLHIVEELSARHSVPAESAVPLTLHESADLRGKLGAWEEDWNAPGMEAYDRP